MTTERLEDEIRSRLRKAWEHGDPVRDVLFHSTCEPISGPLHGDSSGILWAARDPFISLQYIPAAGSEVLVSKVDGWRLNDKVSPSTNDTYYKLACEISGKECFDVEWGPDGQVTSWRVPDGWPSYAHVTRHIEEDLGYKANENGIFHLKERVVDGSFQIEHAEWQIEGQLYMALSAGLSFKDIRRTAEPDLTIYEYYDDDGFELALSQGFDGVIINDHCQSDGYGNVPHLSYGVNANGLEKLEWISVPAVRCTLDDWFEGAVLPSDLERWLASDPEMKVAEQRL